MPRSVAALKIRSWASAQSGERVDPDDSTLTPPLVRTDGWPLSFSEVGGDNLRRQVFNEILYEITEGLLDVAKFGLLPYHASQSFEHPALTLGSDARIYVSVQDSTGEDPVADTTNTYWRPVVNTVSGVTEPPPDSSETLRGIIAIATSAQALTATNDSSAMTPEKVEEHGDARYAMIGATGADIDASLVTSGVLDLARIPNLPASRTTTGSFATGRIPSLDANKITSGVFASGRIPSPTSIAASIITGLLDLTRIPSLPASQTTTGSFHTGRIPNLDANKITTGVLDAGRVPSPSSIAASIITGVLDAARIPNIGAAKITSGTLGTGRIPSLGASIITSGSFHSDRIPNISAAKITSGTLPVSRGGTGSDNAAGARTNLGLPSSATRNIFVEDDAPQSSDGVNGDIWVEY